MNQEYILSESMATARKAESEDEVIIETEEDQLLQRLHQQDDIENGIQYTATKEVVEEVKTIFGINVKKETSVLNLLALFITPMIVMFTGAYVNIQMPYLLQDPDYFDVKSKNVGTEVGKLLFVASLTSTLLAPLMGFIYDIVGRFWVIMVSLLILAI